MEWFNNSKLFEMARQGQRLTHVAGVIPLSIMFMIFGQFGALPVMLMFVYLYGAEAMQGMDFKGFSASAGGMWMGAILVSSFLLVYVFVWLWVRFFEKRAFWTLGYELQNALYQYVRGFGFGALMFSSAVGILALFGMVSFEQGVPELQGSAALAGVFIVLFGWVVQGGGEEIIMRGWVLPVIGARYKPWIGLLISSLIFSLMHSLNPGLNAIALVNLALFGMFTGLYAMREGSMWGVSALHTVWNWVQGNFFGFQVSGTNAAGGTLINLQEAGADWFTGGAFGPEGGLAVTVILLVSIAVTLFWRSPDVVKVA